MIRNRQFDILDFGHWTNLVIGRLTLHGIVVAIDHFESVRYPRGRPDRRPRVSWRGCAWLLLHPLGRSVKIDVVHAEFARVGELDGTRRIGWGRSECGRSGVEGGGGAIYSELIISTARRKGVSIRQQSPGTDVRSGSKLFDVFGPQGELEVDVLPILHV